MSDSIRELSPELAAKAAAEINEVPDKIQADLAILKEWMRKSAHINGRINDDQFLVNFLRGCKYSMEKVKEKLDLFYTIRTQLPEIMTNRDPLSKKNMEIIKHG